jgi:glutathione peroxidase
MVAASPVSGKQANATFKELDARSGEPTWNFNKYLVSSDGTSIRHFESNVAPDSEELRKAIEAVLPKNP